MPRSKKSTTRRVPSLPSPPPDFNIPDEPETYDDAPGEVSIQRLLSQFGEEAITVKVYEARETGEESFLYVISNPTPEKISEEAVRSRNRGKGGRFILRFLVDGDLRTTHHMLLSDDPNAAPVTVAPVAGSSDPLMQILLQRLASMEQMLLTRQVQHEREPINDLADAMLKLQQMNTPKQDMSVDTILKCIELGKSLGTGGASGSEWGGILKDIVKEVGPALAPILMASRGGTPATNTGTLPAQTQENEDMIQRQLMKNGIDYLKKKCKDGSNPALYLEMILDNAEEFPYSELVLIATTQEFSAFTSVDPELGQPPFVDYFKFIYDGIRSAVIQPDPVEGNSAGSSGDKNNPANNGGPGTAGSK